MRCKNILITGISSDIGRTIAEEFYNNGNNIIGTYNENADFTSMFNLFRVNFENGEKVKELIEIKLKKNKIDVLINCVGDYRKSNRETFQINCISHILLSELVFEKMRKNNFGRIISISSIAAKYGSSLENISYGCSKRALEGIALTLAREGASHNVLCNNIRAGVIDTKFHKRNPKDMNKRKEMIPMKKLGTTEDIAKMAYYLGSEENQFITGETITIAGGE